MVTWIVLLSIAALGAGYFTYGRFVAKTLDLDDSRQTPACRINDGKDYGPARGPASQVLLKRWNVKPRLGAHRKSDSLRPTAFRLQAVEMEERKRIRCESFVC